MADNSHSKPDAIIYIPGIAEEPGRTLDDAALRIASALDIGAQTAAAEFQLKQGQDEDYVSVEGNSIKTRVRSILRIEPNVEDRKVANVYEFNYIESLTKGYVERNVLVKGFRLLVRLVMITPRLLRAFGRGRKQKTARQKLQFVFAVGILSLLVVYLAFLGIAIVDIVRQAPEIQAMLSPSADRSNTADSELDEAAQSIEGQQGDQRPTLTFFQLFVILIAGVEVFYPNLKESIIDAAVQYISLIEYLDIGERHQTLSGQFLALIDHVATYGYRNIHIMAFSFGAIIAIDNLFPSGRAPATRMRDIHTLGTIACPYDLIRVFWPNYFKERTGVEDVPQSWINVYSPIDVMASNFRNDSEISEVERENALETLNPSIKLVPSKNIGFSAGRPKRSLSIFESLTLVELEAHSSYWESEFEAEFTAYSPIIEELYENDFPLA